jgi:hypothetical protein
MYCDVTNIRNELFSPDISSLCSFRVVNEMTYRITNPFECMFEFVPVTFENQYFCIANASVHCQLLEFPFRLDSYHTNVEGEDIHEILAKRIEKDHTRAYKLYQTHIGLISEAYDKLVNRFTLLSTSCLSRK